VLVDWDGKPLAGLPSGAIKVRVQRQPTAWATSCTRRTSRRRAATPSRPTGDILTPYDYKIAALGQPLIDNTTPKDVAVIPLTDQGRGIYGATFPDTFIPGTYVFEATLDWDTPLTGHVLREERIEEDVKPAPIRPPPPSP